MTEIEPSQSLGVQHQSNHTTPNSNHSNYATPRTEIPVSLDNYPSPEFNQREVCKKCNKLIVEGHAYELGEDRWHIDCFKCSKCDTSLGCNSNFLVLGNGNLICSNCSYNCKQCGRKIDDLAILTGDQAYCSNCFKCRSCKRKIEDLKYARTSKGLFCMDCHEKLMAKKKRYDAKKRQLATLQEKNSQSSLPGGSSDNRTLEDYRRVSTASSRNSLIQSYMASNGEINKSRSSLYKQGENGSQLSVSSNKNKSLPKAPMENYTTTSSHSLTNQNSQEQLSSKASWGHLGTPEKPHAQDLSRNRKRSNIHPSPVPPVLLPENDFSIEEVQNSSDSDTNEPDIVKQAKGTSLRSKGSNVKSQLDSRSSHTSPVNATDAKVSQQSHLDKSIHLDFQDAASDYPARSKHRKYSDNNQLDAPADLKPSSGKNGDPTKHLSPQTVPQEVTGADGKNKNLLILSPGQFHDHEFHSASMGSPLIDSPGTLISRSSSNDNRLKVQSLSIEQEQYSRSQCPSPYAKANRQARVVEMNDEIQTDAVPVDTDITNQHSAYTTPQQQRPRAGSGSANGSIPIGVSLSSPPPKMPVPNTPTRNKERLPALKFDESVAYGLGLEGVTYSEDDSSKLALDQEADQREYMRQLRQKQEQQRGQGQIHSASVTPQKSKEDLKSRNEHIPIPFSINQSPRIINNPTPAVTNLEDDGQGENAEGGQIPQESPSQPQKVSRTTSLIRNFKHKRSTSGGGGQSKFGLFKSSPREEVNKGGQSTHIRHTSDGSIASSTLGGISSIHSQYFTSPNRAESVNNSGFDKVKAPYSAQSQQTHARSTSDSTMFFDGDPFEMKSIKTEVQKASADKLNLEFEIKRLKQDKLKLCEQLKSIQSNYTEESIKYDNLVNEVRDLEERKLFLTQSNKELAEENERLQSLQKQHRMKQQQQQAPLSNMNIGSSDSMGDDNLTSYSSLSKESKSGHNDYHQKHQNQQQQQQQHPQQHQQQQPTAQQPAAPEDEQTHKATRLKFWRRAKAGGGPHVVNTKNDNNAANGSNNSANSMPHSVSTQGIHGNGNSNGNAQGTNSKFSRSTSANILDSFINSDYNGSNSSGLQLTNSKSTSTVSLFNATLQRRAEYEKTPIPLIVSRCVIEVEKRGLEVEGIYRISGGNSAIVAIENAFSNLGQDPDDKQLVKLNELLDGDIHAVTSALKRYLRKLPDPVIPISNYDEFIHIAASQSQREARLDSLHTLVQKLPVANQSVLHILCQHLNKVASLQDVNRMGVKNLSVVFAPTLARDETGEREMTDMANRNAMTELLLTEYPKLFR
ncbi:RGA2 [Candida metapsilosis]|uniref:RGA2 n=1 Tax=Candida metapsilosis TaxID=273372 RepID=A0A8H7ZBN9_9ASCO|nr:RGA2 [Candida metapsilosis]